MQSRSNTAIWRWAAVLGLAAAFLWGSRQLAQAPLENGEVYPVYSSLRADPLGTKALYESLQALPEVSVTRLYRDPKSLEPGTVLFEFGMDLRHWNSMSTDQLTAYEKLLDHGGRLVLLFLPTRAQTGGVSAEATESSKRWDIRAVFRKQSRDEEDESGLPRETALALDLGSAWKSLKQLDGDSVAAEQPLGKGTLVIVTDSFPLSNEGLRDGRDVKLLAAILGDAQRALFDENALGVSESGSVTGLILKYRLQGTVAVFLLTAGLFIWRNASSFLPPAHNERTRGAAVTGRDTQAGMAALLRRSAGEKQLLETCYTEWERSAKREGSPGQAERVKSEIQRYANQPVEAYRAACLALTRKNT